MLILRTNVLTIEVWICSPPALQVLDKPLLGRQSLVYRRCTACTLLGFVLKFISAPRKKDKETIAGVGRPKQTLNLLLPRPLQEPSVCQRLIFTNSERHRNTGVGKNPNWRLGGMSCPGPLRNVPEKPQPKSPLVIHMKVSQCWRNIFWTE